MRANPQVWMPIGQKVNVTTSPTPWIYDETGNRYRASTGCVVEHLNNGGLVVLFDNYPHTWDYSAREARGFGRIC